MNRSLRACAALVVLSLATLAAAPPASAAGIRRENLSWESSRAVVGDRSVYVHSNERCPDRRADGLPRQGVRQVFVMVLFSFGGGMGQGPIAVAPDGSWSGVVHFRVSGDVHDADAVIVAECDDVTFTGYRIATYRPHHITVN